MRCVSLRALAAQSMLLLPLLPVRHANAQTLTATTTMTVMSTTTVFTSTTTIMANGVTITSVTTETGVNVGVSTVVVSPIPIATSAVSPAASSNTPYQDSGFPAAVLNSTNYYRAQHQANQLSWDDNLASYAQSYAQQCVFKHSGGPFGENIVEGFPNSALAIDAWADEESKYNYAKPKFSEATGHYTQLVWKNTTAVGCGAAQCSNSTSNGANGWFLVCEYNPRGNVDGQFAEEVSKAGESASGKPGLGAASSVRMDWRIVLVALVASYVLVGIYV